VRVPDVEADIDVRVAELADDVGKQPGSAVDHVLDMEADARLPLEKLAPEGDPSRKPALGRAESRHVAVMENDVGHAEAVGRSIGKLETIACDLPHHGIEAPWAEIRERPV
jgi:hypothetical protein